MDRAQLYSDRESPACQQKSQERLLYFARLSAWTLTVVPRQIRITNMNDKENVTKPEPARDEWVRVNPDKPAYQRLHLCQYLAELPELEPNQPAEEQPR